MSTSINTHLYICLLFSDNVSVSPQCHPMTSPKNAFLLARDINTSTQITARQNEIEDSQQ